MSGSERARVSKSESECTRVSQREFRSQVQVQSLKRSCKMQFRRIDLRSKHMTKSNLWPHLPIVKLQLRGHEVFKSL